MEAVSADAWLTVEVVSAEAAGVACVAAGVAVSAVGPADVPAVNWELETAFGNRDLA